eukprot:1344595-Amphidinium_carterae.2
MLQHLRDESSAHGDTQTPTDIDRLKGDPKSVHRTLNPASWQRSCEREVLARIAASQRAFVHHLQALTSAKFALCAILYLYNAYVLPVLVTASA